MMRLGGIEKMTEYSAWRRCDSCSRISLLTICALLLLITGCSSGSIKQFVRPDTDMSTVRTVAVLPLNNFTLDNFAAQKVRSKISIELLSRGINVIEPGEIVLTLKELKIVSPDSMRKENIVAIGNILNADAIIGGSVEAFGISQGITVSYPEVSVHLMMFDSVSGDTIWSVWHTTGGAGFWTRHFGAEGSTLDRASARVINEAFDALFDKSVTLPEEPGPEEEKETATSGDETGQSGESGNKVQTEKHAQGIQKKTEVVHDEEELSLYRDKTGQAYAQDPPAAPGEKAVGMPIEIRMAEPSEKSDRE
jgi:hypothetical protein